MWALDIARGRIDGMGHVREGHAKDKSREDMSRTCQGQVKDKSGEDMSRTSLGRTCQGQEKGEQVACFYDS